MNTVIAPETLKNSKHFRPIMLKNIYDPKETADESFFFIFPSSDIFNQENGDGDLLEIEDVNRDFTEIYTSHRKYKVTPETIIYVRD